MFCVAHETFRIFALRNRVSEKAISIRLSENAGSFSYTRAMFVAALQAVKVFVESRERADVNRRNGLVVAIILAAVMTHIYHVFRLESGFGGPLGRSLLNRILGYRTLPKTQLQLPILGNPRLRLALPSRA